MHAEFGGEAPDTLVERWADTAESLTAVQRAAINAGILRSDRNFLVMAPTSSGKTLVGEMAAASAAYSRRGSAVFLVPYRALAEEHFLRFHERYRELISVVISTGDWSEFDEDVIRGNFGLAVMTYEKLATLLVDAPGLLRRINCVVVDEVQMLGEDERGARLELLLTQLLTAPERPQVVALSASLDHLNDIDRWLEAQLVASSERPVALHESVLGPSGIALTREGTDITRQRVVPAQADSETLLHALVRREVEQHRQVLIFRTTISRTERTASALATALPARGIPDRLLTSLNSLEGSDITNTLRRTLAAGVGLHNADMTLDERRVAEEAFRSGDARVLVSTTTLAMGVNLPTDTVVIADSVRYAPHPLRGWQSTNISVAEYRNSAGRAGRLGLRQSGTCFLLAESDDERRQLVDFYVLGETEPVESQIPKRPFTDLVFQFATSRSGCNREEVVELVTRTFAYRSFYERLGEGLEDVRRAVEDAVAVCIEAGLLEEEGGSLYPSKPARSMARRGVSFASAVALGASIRAEQQTALSRAEVFFAATANRDTGTNPYVRREYGQPVDPRPLPAAQSITTTRRDGFLARALSTRHLSEPEAQALIKLSCVVDFAEGVPYASLSRRYAGAAPSRVATLGKNVAWQVEAFADALQDVGTDPERVAELRSMVLEARYGVPAAAASMARLRVPGIPRETIAQLVPMGLADIDTAVEAPSEQFEPVLTALQVSRLKAAILADAEDTQDRRKAGQLARLERTSVPARIVNSLYTATAGGLEQAVVEVFEHVGISATRVLRQPHGEEDIQVAHSLGLIVVSVTASDSAAKRVPWRKAREVLAAGAGQNPMNYVCIGRPDFDELASRRAAEIATETGPRSVLLIPLPTFAEAFVRMVEGRLTASVFLDLLGRAAGSLQEQRLDEVAPLPDVEQ